MRKGNTNIQTMVFKVDIINNADKNDTLFVMGDGTSPAWNELYFRHYLYLTEAERENSALRCYYVQVSHHGHAIKLTSVTEKHFCYARRDNSTEEIYRAVGATVAFWSTSTNYYDTRKNKTASVNKYLTGSSSTVKTHILADSDAALRTKTFSL